MPRWNRRESRGNLERAGQHGNGADSHLRGVRGGAGHLLRGRLQLNPTLDMRSNARRRLEYSVISTNYSVCCVIVEERSGDLQGTLRAHRTRRMMPLRRLGTLKLMSSPTVYPLSRR